jgi:hypothetical protein
MILAKELPRVAKMVNFLRAIMKTRFKAYSPFPIHA